MKITIIQIPLYGEMEVEYTLKALTTAMNRYKWLDRNGNRSYLTEISLYEDVINRIKEARENAKD